MSSARPYPLSWPKGLPRTKSRLTSAFKTGLPAALKNVENSLKLFSKDSGKPVTSIVISSNASLGVSAPSDPGVSVWFVWDNTELCIAVDRYAKVQDNLQAIHNVLEARRVELRHGGLHLIHQTFQGFKARELPPGDRDCWAVLGIPENSGKTDIEEAYKLKVVALRDANNASEENIKQLNIAKQEALETL